MRLLHSADWHLGARLYGQSREAEQERFLDELLTIIRREAVEALLLAGDVFDSATPSLGAQTLYYRFLARLLETPCRQTVIVAGNHDNPSFLQLPAGLLRALHIHIVGRRGELIALRDADGETAALVAAVPYLRERELRTLRPEESPAEGEAALVAAVLNHYEELARAGLAERGERDWPLLAMGHLFAAGGRTADDEAIRDLYVGKLGLIPAEKLPTAFDYIALGHLHRQQRLSAPVPIYYSGAPLAYSFGEAEATKGLLLLETEGRTVHVRPLALPSYQRLERLRGNAGELLAALRARADEDVWLEALHTGPGSAGTLYQQLQRELEGRRAKLLRLQVPAAQLQSLNADEVPTLESLTPLEVFNLRLQREELDPTEADALRARFLELLTQAEAAE